MYKKLILYSIGLNQFFSDILDFSSDFLTFIDVLMETFLSLLSLLLILLKKISLLTDHQIAN